MVVIDLIYLCVLLLSFPVWIRYLFRKKYRELIRRRFSPECTVRADKPIWIHSVSVGEARSVKGLIDSLQKIGKRVVLSVTTPSGYEFARREYPEIQVIPAPLDFSFVIRRFLRRIDPELILFNELELWPNWITTARRCQVPLLLINGRISDLAFRKYNVFAPLTRRFLKGLDGLIVQSERYRQRFLEWRIPADRIWVCGHIKADEATEQASRLPGPREIAERLGINSDSRPKVVIASSHRSDEDLIIPVIHHAADRFAFIIAPRHPERVSEIERRLQQEGVTFRRFGELSKNGRSDVVIIDQIGYLMETMSIADLVWMGGTCSRRIGGHNLFEPAALGKPIAGGKHYENFSDIGSALEKVGVYRRVENGSAFLSVIQEIGSIPGDEIRKRAMDQVQARLGSVACTIERIRQFSA